MDIKKFLGVKRFRNLFWAAWGSVALIWLAVLQQVTALDGMDKALFFGLAMVSLLVVSYPALKASNAANAKVD